MKDFYAKTKEGALLRVTVEDENNPISPREDADALIGKMYVPDLINESDVKTDNLYGFFSQGLQNAGREEEAISMTLEADFNTSKGTEIAAAKAYRAWKKDLCAALPVFHYSHGGDTVRTNAELKNELADGVIYVSWDNPNVKEMLKTHTKEETQKWAEDRLADEVYDYDCYLTGEVYKATVECFNPYTMQWGDEPNIQHDVYPNKNVSYNKQRNNMAKRALLDTEFFAGTYKAISANEAKKIIETPSEEYKNIIGEQFLTEVKNNMAEFGNNIDHAQKAVSLVYTTSKDKMTCAALSAYLKETGCTTKDKTLAFMSSKLGPMERNLPQLSAGQAGCTTLVARDRYNQTRGGVVIDYQNKVFALWQGQGVWLPPMGGVAAYSYGDGGASHRVVAVHPIGGGALYASGRPRLHIPRGHTPPHIPRGRHTPRPTDGHAMEGSGASHGGGVHENGAQSAKNAQAAESDISKVTNRAGFMGTVCSAPQTLVFGNSHGAVHPMGWRLCPAMAGSSDLQAWDSGGASRHGDGGSGAVLYIPPGAPPAPYDAGETPSLHIPPGVAAAPYTMGAAYFRPRGEHPMGRRYLWGWGDGSGLHSWTATSLPSMESSGALAMSGCIHTHSGTPPATPYTPGRRHIHGRLV